ncbi:hypothetical protein EBR96_01750 [bacterium]|nr:hypothetical protein [bacterium]
MMKWILGIILGLTLQCGVVHAVVPPRLEQAHLDRKELFRVAIENWLDGSISVSTDKGNTWIKIGHVLVPNMSTLHEIQDGEFTASDWAPIGGVAATAVNAIHLKVAHAGSHGSLFSILPKELLTNSVLITSYLSRSSSIYVDIPGGQGILGGDWSFRIGDPLYLISSPNGEMVPWPNHRAPELGDTMVIVAQAPPVNEWTIEFDNKVGGNVTFFQEGEPPKTIAKVIKPFQGSGNFQGGFFQSTGKIRANHPGVIDVSTSPYHQIGGFQIVPLYHSKAQNLSYVHKSPVYMVVAPLDEDGFLEGQPPLFNGFIRPGDIVEAKMNGVWRPFPESIGRQFSAFTAVESVRVRSGRTMTVSSQ